MSRCSEDVWDLKSMISGLVFIVNWIEVTDSNLIQALWDCVVSAKIQVAILVWIWFWLWISKNLVKPAVRNAAVFWALPSTRQTLWLVGSTLVSNFKSNRLALRVLESNPGLRYRSKSEEGKVTWINSLNSFQGDTAISQLRSLWNPEWRLYNFEHKNQSLRNKCHSGPSLTHKSKLPFTT